MIGRYPQTALTVVLYRSNAITAEYRVGIITAQLHLVDVIDIKSVIGTNPQFAGIFLDDSDRRAVVETVFAKHTRPAVLLNVQTADAHRRSDIDTFLVGREGNLGDIVIGDAVHGRVVRSILCLHGIGSHLIGADVDTQETLSHGAHPHIATLGALYGETTGIAILRELMVGTKSGINISEALAIGADPDTAVPIFTNAHDGGRTTFLEMLDQRDILNVQTIKTVLVGTYPHASLAVGHDTDHAGLTDNVTLAELIAHIMETHGFTGLHIDAFLQQAQPDITAAVFHHGIDLALAQRYLAAIVGIVFNCSGLGIINGNALAVVAEHHATVMATEHRRDMMITRHVKMTEVATLGRTDIDTVRRSAHIDVAFVVTTKPASRVALLFRGEVTADILPVIFQQAFMTGDNPDMSLQVFHKVVDRMDILQHTAHLLRMATVNHLEQAMTGGSGQQLAIPAQQETGHVAGHHTAVDTLYLDIGEMIAVKGLEGTVHTDIEQAVVVLRHAVHVVAGHVGHPFLLYNMELVAVIPVEAVSGSYPDKAITIQINLTGKTARQLFVGIKQLPHLSSHAQTRQNSK